MSFYPKEERGEVGTAPVILFYFIYLYIFGRRDCVRWNLKYITNPPKHTYIYKDCTKENPIIPTTNYKISFEGTYTKDPVLFF